MSSVRVRHLRSRGLWIAALVVVQLLGFASGAVAQEAATITGRVTNAEGAGIPGVSVRAVDSVNYVNADYGSTVTDVGGYYTLPVGALMNVIVMFEPADSNVANSTDYIGEFYGDVAYVLRATHVAPGASGINAQLAVGGSVSGTVYGPLEAAGLAGIEVEARTGSAFDPETVTVAGGAYVLRGVPEGTPIIAAAIGQYNWDNNTDFVEARVDTSVTSGAQTTGLDITLGQGGRIRGTVTGGGAPLEGVEVRAADANQWYVSYSGYTAGDGTYVLRGVAPGESYRVSFTSYQDNAANGTAYLTQYYNGVADPFSATLIAVTPRGETLGIDAAMHEAAPTMGSITGTVYGPDGRTPLEGVLVHASPSMSWTYTLADGTYELTDLAPGYYSVWFETFDLSESYPDPVEVTAGMVSLGVNATLEGAPVDSTPPAVPTNVSASQTAAGEITVTWRASEDAPGDVDHYVLYVSNGMNEPSTIDVAPVDGQDQSCILSGLEAGDYTVWVTAVDAAGNESAPSESVLVALDMQAPSTGIQVSSEPGNSGWYLTEPLVTLTMDEAGTIHYGWGDGVVVSASSSATFAAPQGANTLTYWSVDVAGNTDVPRTMEFKVDTVAPAAPADLVATASGETTIDLSWAPVTDDASGISSYIVLMDGSLLAEVSGTDYQVTGLLRDTYHEFIVFALDAAGNMGTQSAVAGATTFRNPGSARRRYPEHPEHP